MVVQKRDVATRGVKIQPFGKAVEKGKKQKGKRDPTGKPKISNKEKKKAKEKKEVEKIRPRNKSLKGEWANGQTKKSYTFRKNPNQNGEKRGPTLETKRGD